MPTLLVFNTQKKKLVLLSLQTPCSVLRFESIFMKQFDINLPSVVQEHTQPKVDPWSLVVVRSHFAKSEQAGQSWYNRAPHWRGGGVVHGPHPRSHALQMNKKEEKQLFALR